MAREANTARRDSAQPITSQQVQEAWEAFAALQKAERLDPSLRQNRYYEPLKDAAYARFMLAFEAMS